jgi:hypothetical protein
MMLLRYDYFISSSIVWVGRSISDLVRLGWRRVCRREATAEGDVASGNSMHLGEGDAHSTNETKGDLLYYTHALAPTLLVGVILNLFFAAYIFTLIEADLRYADALWHCWVTAWTVGFVPSLFSLLFSLLFPFFFRVLFSALLCD